MKKKPTSKNHTAHNTKRGEPKRANLDYKVLKLPYETIRKAIDGLPNKRMKEVVLERFGLNNNSPKTLERIGEKLKITRERVRQIENEALKKIFKAKASNKVDYVLNRIKQIIEKYKGIASELRILKEYNPQQLGNNSQKSILLALRMGNDFSLLNKPKEFERAWYSKKANLGFIYKLNKHLKKNLSDFNKPIQDQDIVKLINQEKELSKLPDEVLYSYIDIPKQIQKNIFGQWGLVSWPIIAPKKIKDKIYLVFQGEKKPLHYEEIAKKIDEYKLNKRKVCIPTVHNELIKDPRFILTGRGIYALKEWNFFPGTVKQVLIRIFKDNGSPLSKEFLIQETLKQRQVKASTILLNLQDSKIFKKRKDGKYSLKK
ncbi:MAG: hypothetical protein GF332_04630 [Candidatus Moranbacteria bacterium]|nr:hypothetical protein [Candidatus Moranbacteria bacterium]